MDQAERPRAATLEDLRRVIAISPFATLTKTEVLACADGSTEVAMPNMREHAQHHGVLHGGLVGYLADTALSFAAASVAGDIVTADYHLHLLAPGIGERFLARGRVLKAGRRRIVAAADVFAIIGAKETLIATAMGTLMPTGER